MAEQHEKALVPQIRFTGFTDPWEQRKLGELVEIERGGSPRPIEQYITDDPCGLNWVKIGDAPELGRYITKTAEKIKPEGLSKTRQVYPGDLVLSNSMSFGRPYIMAIKGCVHDGWLLIRDAQKHFDPIFLCHMLGAPQMLNQYRMFAAGSTVNNLNKELVGNAIVSLPSKNEQHEIGIALDRLDSLITLHQGKYDKLCVLKKSMLDKMFPKGGSLYPEIRFAGFTDPWEQRKLGEVAHFINGRAYSQNELLSSGKYPVLRVGNFYTNDSWYYSNLELEDKNYAYEGDLLYTWSATFGPHIWHGNKVIYHYHIWKVQLEAAFEKLFAFQLLERDKERILSDKNGSTMVHITKIGIENTSVLMPCSVIEQRQIGAFLDRLDSLITLHQRKYDGCANPLFLERRISCRKPSHQNRCSATTTPSG